MADNEQLHDLERSETENALLPAAFSVRAYQYEPRRPTITIAAYDSESGPSSEDETEPEEGGRLGNTDWCECGQCRPMEKEEDCICCREFEIMDPIREAYNVTCITDHPGYERNCLNEHVVETSFYEFLDYHGHVGDEKPIHELYRHVAYRRFTGWVWHRLGKGKRIKVPSCATHNIRDKWPSEVYTGFKYVRDY